MKKFYTFRRALFDPIAWYLSRKELHSLLSKASGDVGSIVDVAEKYIGRGYYARIHAYQRRTEIIQLGRLIQQLQPKTIVEIGTDKGGTLFLWCRLLHPSGSIASIDLPGGNFGGGYDAKRIRLYREFLFDKPQTRTLFLRNNSHDPAVRTQLVTWLESRSVDFLYIDGDHTHQGVRRDFEMYQSLVRPGGVIAFHDIRTKGQGHEVFKFWDEIKNTHQHQEMIENPAGPMGIGVIQVSHAG